MQYFSLKIFLCYFLNFFSENVQKPPIYIRIPNYTPILYRVPIIPLIDPLIINLKSQLINYTSQIVAINLIKSSIVGESGFSSSKLSMMMWKTSKTPHLPREFRWPPLMAIINCPVRPLSPIPSLF